MSTFMDKQLLEPYTYLSEVPGKEVRSHLISSFNKWLGLNKDIMLKIREIVQMLHNASLLIDDIEDNSKMRRGLPVAHTVFGIPLTINCANYVYFLAMDKCNQLGKPEATQIFIEELISLHKGQGKDIYWRDTNSCPTEEQYKEMVLEKTGGLFRLAVRLMQVFSASKSDFIPLVNYLGLYFQIRDDYINLQSSTYMVNKSFCEDLTEGKFSFPIVHSILSNTEDKWLLNILKQKTESKELKEAAVEYMSKMGSFKYTLQVMETYKTLVLEEIQKLGGNDELSTLIIELDSKL
eukprot:TRINITY_DN3313_c0_g2_i1.p1 TRINITY_DN3313_c0_g2~~TRINITY_DN3313_c0_g2_i1.p1  ORF type:complete len:293 (-),score=54.31 TRINITY_DN3313_c0_g2_i1:145-1023(-)